MTTRGKRIEEGCASDEGGGTQVSGALGGYSFCYLTGTSILTTNGPKVIESLRAGELLVTNDGRQVPLKWLAKRTVSTRFGPAERFLPVRIAAGALGPSMPERDLIVSMDHGLLIDGVVAHAGALVNGTSIDWLPLQELGERFVYWHLETDAHDFVLAEGATAETFIDNVSRRAFDNYAEFVARFGADVPDVVQSDYPRATTARHLPDPIRQRLQRLSV